MKKLPFYTVVVLVTLILGALVYTARDRHLNTYHDRLSGIEAALEEAYQPFFGTLDTYLDGHEVNVDEVHDQLEVLKFSISQQHAALASIAVPGEARSRQLHGSAMAYLQHSRVIEEMFTQAARYMADHNPATSEDITVLQNYFAEALQKDIALSADLKKAIESMATAHDITP